MLLRTHLLFPLPTKIIQVDEKELILYPKQKEQIILFKDILNISKAKFLLPFLRKKCSRLF